MTVKELYIVGPEIHLRFICRDRVVLGHYLSPFFALRSTFVARRQDQIHSLNAFTPLTLVFVNFNHHALIEINRIISQCTVYFIVIADEFVFGYTKLGFFEVNRIVRRETIVASIVVMENIRSLYFIIFLKQLHFISLIALPDNVVIRLYAMILSSRSA